MAKIATILTHRFADWEYALIGGTGGPFYGLDVRYFSPEKGDVVSQGGLAAHVSLNFADLVDWAPDAVAVIGGMIWETDQAPDVSNLLISQYERGAAIAGICGGTLALARSGLLNENQHTSNDRAFLRRAKNYTGAELYTGSSRAIMDKRVITAPGSAPVSFTAKVFEAVGMAPELIQEFIAMMAAEHL